MCNFLDEPTSPERGGGPRAAWRWGFAVRRIPFGKYLGEFAETPLGSPAGGAGSPLGLTERATAPTPFWRVKGALKGMVVTNSPGLSQNRSCMLPLSVSLCSTAPPKGEPSGLLRIRPRFHKTIGAYREPLSQPRWGCQLPFQGRQGRNQPPLSGEPRANRPPLSGARWVPYSSVVVISLTVLAMSKKGA